MTSFAVIGLGEVGAIFARDLHKGGASRISGYDIDAAARSRAEGAGHAAVRGSAVEAASDAEVIFVAVTAGSVTKAMSSLSGGLSHQPFVIDVNSVSPSTKRAAARIVGEAGGRYVEAAVMTSVPPHGLRSPMLLGGAHASDFMALMQPFDMRLELFGEEIGGASSVKMCRSIVIKGLEAIVTESMLAARRYGVEERVLASLADTLPLPDWSGRARYLMGRALVHGRRRSEEMREVARTVAEAGFVPTLSEAIAEKQQWAAEQGFRLGSADPPAQDLGALLDALLALPA